MTHNSGPSRVEGESVEPFNLFIRLDTLFFRGKTTFATRKPARLAFLSERDFLGVVSLVFVDTRRAALKVEIVCLVDQFASTIAVSEEREECHRDIESGLDLLGGPMEPNDITSYGNP